MSSKGTLWLAPLHATLVLPRGLMVMENGAAGIGVLTTLREAEYELRSTTLDAFGGGTVVMFYERSAVEAEAGLPEFDPNHVSVLTAEGPVGGGG